LKGDFYIVDTFKNKKNINPIHKISIKKIKKNKTCNGSHATTGGTTNNTTGAGVRSVRPRFLVCFIFLV